MLTITCSAAMQGVQYKQRFSELCEKQVLIICFLFLLLLCLTDSSAWRTYSVFHHQTPFLFIQNIRLLTSKTHLCQPPCIHLLQAF